MKELKVTFRDNSFQIFSSDRCYWTIDNQSRMIYIVYPFVVIRIPYESIKLFEETREMERSKDEENK